MASIAAGVMTPSEVDTVWTVRADAELFEGRATREVSVRDAAKARAAGKSYLFDWQRVDRSVPVRYP